MAFIAQSIRKKIVSPEPEEIHDTWKEVVACYGEPEILIPKTVWVVKAARDKEWFGYKAGDPVMLITNAGKLD